MPSPARIAFFDVDETLLALNSLTSFLKYRLPAAYPGAVRALRALIDAGCTREEVSRAYYRLYEGCDADALRRCGEDWFATLATPQVFIPGTLAAFRAHQEAGDLTVLVSGSLPACIDPVGRYLGADEVACADLAIVDGRYTGAVRSTMLGEAKADRVRRIAGERGVPLTRCYAYGDHPSDLPMLQAVGHPVVVGDDPVLAARVHAISAPAAESPECTGQAQLAKG